MSDSAATSTGLQRLHGVRRYVIDFLLPPSLETSRNYATEPPLGLLSIMSAMPSDLGVDMQLLDSTLLPEDIIRRKLAERAADVVAISCNTYNYANGLKLAEYAKSNGSVVVMGGLHITQRCDTILPRMKTGSRPMDYLIVGEGEASFWQLVKALMEKQEPIDIPGLSYVDHLGVIRKNVPSSPTVTAQAEKPLDYQLIDLDVYSQHFRTFGNIAHSKKVAPMFTQRGCPLVGKRRCDFCSISRNLATRSADLVAADFKSLAVNEGCDHIRIIDPQLTPTKHYLDTVGKAIGKVRTEEQVNPSLYCFVRADSVDQERIAALKQLNIVSVFVGYDSGSDRMLKAMNKRTTAAQNIEATKRLADVGIDVLCCGLVLGAEGEDERSLAETVHFVQSLQEIGNVRSTLATPLTPLPGSVSYERLLAKLSAQGVPEAHRIANDDVFDLDLGMALWNQHMASVSMEDLRETAKQISQIMPIEIVF
uniref:B12-binding domain-containing radical SAM protein n=1 Tax=Candidatus Electronema sp. TaxID=2698783 RepID=UPI004056E526